MGSHPGNPDTEVVTGKAFIEAAGRVSVGMVKAQGFRHWTILKPAMIMQNFVPHVVDSRYPSLAERGRFETATEPDTGIDWILAKDIGAFAAAAGCG